jgi:hypothetical protein
LLDPNKWRLIRTILDGIIGRETVVVTRRESAPLPLHVAGRLMRDFGSIASVSLYTMSHVAENTSYGSGVTSRFLCNDPQWFGTLAPQQSP